MELEGYKYNKIMGFTFPTSSREVEYLGCYADDL